MINEVLDRYKVQFSKPVNYHFHNKVITCNDLMTQIIGDHYSLYEVNALLDIVNTVVDDTNINSFDHLTKSLQYLIITKEVTNMYDSEDDNVAKPYFSLPTNHFKVIIEAWRNYLVQSPTTKLF